MKIVGFLGVTTLLVLTSCSQQSVDTQTPLSSPEENITSEKMMDTSKEESTMEKEKMMDASNEDMIKNDDMNADVKMEAKAGTYSIYEAGKLSSTENNVLFFAATWCPACQNADKNFSASEIPAGINLLKVDYDSNEELKKQYSVTMQHTFVLVDETGKMIKKWSGSNDVSDVEMRVKN